MFKLNFEKTVLFVVILIILISTANIYTQYIKNTMFNEDGSLEHFDKSNLNMNSEVPTTLFKADKLYEEHNYKAAAAEYGNLIANNKLISTQQKALAEFKLGMCNYMLKYYEKALADFENCLQFNQNDAVAYNNSAICAFYLKDFKKAVKYQEKALEILPAVEYYYNMGRIYETIEDYSNAAKYYAGVIKGEENITYSSFIDPVNIKGKLNRLARDEIQKKKLLDNIIIVLKQRDMREALVLEDNNMYVKSYEFEWKIASTNGTERLFCNYDIKKNDPFKIINSLSWVIKSGNSVIYKSKKDNFSISISEDKDYLIELYIDYGNGNTKYVYQKINKEQFVNKGSVDKDNNNKDEGQDCRSYPFASYEQLFEKNFKLNSKGYKDRFSVEWGKDSVDSKIIDDVSMDGKSSLYIENKSDDSSGIWANLNSVLKSKNLQGKKVAIRFYGRRVTEKGKIDVRVRTRSEGMYEYNYETYVLDYKWQQVGFDVDIPKDSDSFTLSIDLRYKEAIEIDGLIVYVK